MPSVYPDDPDQTTNKEQLPAGDLPEQQPSAEQPATPAETPAEQPASPNSGDPQREHYLAGAPYEEPQVAAKVILTAIFKSGGKSEGELEQILSTHNTTMDWATYWREEGFLAISTSSNAERRWALTFRAVAELELQLEGV